MTEWLGHHRLLRHAEAITAVTGSDATPSDLQFLTEDDIEELGTPTHSHGLSRPGLILSACAQESQSGFVSVASMLGLCTNKLLCQPPN